MNLDGTRPAVLRAPEMHLKNVAAEIMADDSKKTQNKPSYEQFVVETVSTRIHPPTVSLCRQLEMESLGIDGM